jgi:hypothetical protein
MKEMLKAKKGQAVLSQAPAFIITLVIIGVVAAVGMLIFGALAASDVIASNTEAQTVINNSQDTVLNYTALLPIVGTIFAAVVLLGAVAFIGFSYMKNQ